MSETPLVQRKLVGANDILWIFGIFFTGAVVTTLLLGHLRNGFELYKLGNQLAYASTESRLLENDRRSLEIELQHRTEAVDVWSAAEQMGFRPVGDGQFVVVEVR